jgi:hypothetical protein
MPHPLQLSQRKGKKSRKPQYGIWQCEPIASTSPPFISVKLVGSGVEDAMLDNCDGIIYAEMRLVSVA